MTDLVKPFAALRPETDRAADVIAPPYDVVNTDEARSLAAGRPWSFLHVSRPEIDLPEGTDSHANEVYARGAANLEKMRESGVLTREATPSFYVYRMRMGQHEQTGIACIASTRAYEENRVRKHELTRVEKENDRVRNIEALNAQTGPVLTAYWANDAVRELLEAGTRGPALFEVEGPNQVIHTLWRIGEPDAVARLQRALNALGTLYIADGHHRSAAATRVAQARRKADKHQAEANDQFFLTVAFPHDEMRIFDYNRVVTDLAGMTPEGLLSRLREHFTVEPASDQVRPERPASFGMYLAGHWYTLSLAPDAIPADPVGSLDVSLLQNLVIGPLFGINDPRTDNRIDFVGGVRGLGALEKRVDEGSAAVAFSLFPTSMEQLMAVADAQKLMPPKSTWFEPKLADGLLSHVLD